MIIQGMDIEKMSTDELLDWLESIEAIRQQRRKHIESIMANIDYDAECISALVKEVKKRSKSPVTAP